MPPRPDEVTRNKLGCLQTRRPRRQWNPKQHFRLGYAGLSGLQPRPPSPHRPCVHPHPLQGHDGIGRPACHHLWPHCKVTLFDTAGGQAATLRGPIPDCWDRWPCRGPVWWGIVLVLPCVALPQSIKQSQSPRRAPDMVVYAVRRQSKWLHMGLAAAKSQMSPHPIRPEVRHCASGRPTTSSRHLLSAVQRRTTWSLSFRRRFRVPGCHRRPSLRLPA
jgi:hypothetical protein